MKHDELLDVVVNRLIAEGVTEKNYTSFKALRALRKCIMGRKLVCYLISGNEIKVQQRLAELSQTKQINATELPYIKQQFTASGEQPTAEDAEEYIKVKHPQDWDEIPQWHIDEIKEFATLHAQRIADKMVSERLRAMIERCKKLEFMIENGLGWKDMENDITMPHEL